MKQHAIPQDIKSYQFRLVGNMTLKQFLELASGVVAGFIINSLPIPSFFKIPLIVFAVILGVMLAFFPIEERPLDVWITNFFKAVYGPTQYLWKKQKKELEVIQFSSRKTPQAQQKIADTSVPRVSLDKYLETLPLPQQTVMEKNKRLEEIEKLLNADLPTEAKQTISGPQTTANISASDPRATLKVKVRKMQSQEKTQENIIFQASSNVQPINPQDFPQTNPQAILQTPSPIPPTPTPPSPVLNNTSNPLPDDNGVKKVLITTSEPKKEPIVKPAAPLTPPLPVNTAPTEKKQKPDPEYPNMVPKPQPVKSPNLLVGVVTDQKGNMVSNALIEIKNEQGITIRALKTDETGKFLTTNPLPNGKYNLTAEHDHFKFDIIKVILEGKIVPPLNIKGTKLDNIKEEDEPPPLKLY